MPVQGSREGVAAWSWRVWLPKGKAISLFHVEGRAQIMGAAVPALYAGMSPSRFFISLISLTSPLPDYFADHLPVDYHRRIRLSFPWSRASGKSSLTSSPSPRSRNRLKTSRIVQRGRTQGRGRGSQTLWAAAMPHLSKTRGTGGTLGVLGEAGFRVCARWKFSQHNPSPPLAGDPNLGPMTPMPSCYWLNGLGFRPRQGLCDVIRQGTGPNVPCTMPRTTGA